jgi:starvation-inducible DNA-binding protein
MSDQTIVEALQVLQADATVHYQKLRHYHWHVKGEQFFVLHAKFEELYDHWAEFIDDVAERILTIGGTALPTLKDVLKHATLKEDTKFPTAKAMVEAITKDLESMLKSARKIKVLAEKHDDAGTVNMMDNFLDEGYKTLWMLHAFMSK